MDKVRNKPYYSNVVTKKIVWSLPQAPKRQGENSGSFLSENSITQQRNSFNTPSSPRNSFNSPAQTSSPKNSFNSIDINRLSVNQSDAELSRLSSNSSKSNKDSVVDEFADFSYAAPSSKLNSENLQREWIPFEKPDDQQTTPSKSVGPTTLAMLRKSLSGKNVLDDKTNDRGDLENSIEYDLFSRHLFGDVKVLCSGKQSQDKKVKKEVQYITIARDKNGAYGVFFVSVEAASFLKKEKKTILSAFPFFGNFELSAIPNDNNYKFDFSVEGENVVIALTDQTYEKLLVNMMFAQHEIQRTMSSFCNLNVCKLATMEFVSAFDPIVYSDIEVLIDSAINNRKYSGGQIDPISILRKAIKQQQYRDVFLTKLLEVVEDNSFKFQPTEQVHHVLNLLDLAIVYPSVSQISGLPSRLGKALHNLFLADVESSIQNLTSTLYASWVQFFEDTNSYNGRMKLIDIPFPAEFFVGQNSVFLQKVANQHQRNSLKTRDALKSLKQGLFIVLIIFSDNEILSGPSMILPSFELECIVYQEYANFDSNHIYFEWLSSLGPNWLKNARLAGKRKDPSKFKTAVVNVANQINHLFGIDDAGFLYDKPIVISSTNTIFIPSAKKIADKMNFRLPDGYAWKPKQEFEHLLILNSESTQGVNDWIDAAISFSKKITWPTISPGIHLVHFRYVQSVSGVFVLVKENERNILPYITVKEGQISQSFLDQVQTMNWNNGDVVFSEQGPNDSFKQGLKTAAHELKSQLGLQSLGLLYSKEFICVDETMGIYFLVSIESCADLGKLATWDGKYCWQKLSILEQHQFNTFCPVITDTCKSEIYNTQLAYGNNTSWVNSGSSCDELLRIQYLFQENFFRPQQVMFTMGWMRRMIFWQQFYERNPYPVFKLCEKGQSAIAHIRDIIASLSSRSPSFEQLLQTNVFSVAGKPPISSPANIPLEEIIPSTTDIIATISEVAQFNHRDNIPSTVELCNVLTREIVELSFSVVENETFFEISATVGELVSLLEVMDDITWETCTAIQTEQYIGNVIQTRSQFKSNLLERISFEQENGLLFQNLSEGTSSYSSLIQDCLSQFDNILEHFSTLSEVITALKKMTMLCNSIENYEGHLHKLGTSTQLIIQAPVDVGKLVSEDVIPPPLFSGNNHFDIGEIEPGIRATIRRELRNDVMKKRVVGRASAVISQSLRRDSPHTRFNIASQSEERNAQHYDTQLFRSPQDSYPLIPLPCVRGSNNSSTVVDAKKQPLGTCVSPQEGMITLQVFGTDHRFRVPFTDYKHRIGIPHGAIIIMHSSLQVVSLIADYMNCSDPISFIHHTRVKLLYGQIDPYELKKCCELLMIPSLFVILCHIVCKDDQHLILALSESFMFQLSVEEWLKAQAELSLFSECESVFEKLWFLRFRRETKRPLSFSEREAEYKWIHVYADFRMYQYLADFVKEMGERENELPLMKQLGSFVRRLSFKKIPVLNDSHVQIIVQLCPGLTHLSLPRSDISDLALQYLGTCKHLQLLDIARCAKVTQQGMRVLSSQLQGRFANGRSPLSDNAI